MDILGEVSSICSDEAFQRRLVDFLCRICEVDTSPAQELAHLREGERRVFEIVRAALAELELPGSSISWREISPAIQTHPAFSQPYYAPGPVEEVYRGRGNLLFSMDGDGAAGGRGVALNAHIDTVAPFFGPERSGDSVGGRGAADDKGNVAVILGTLQVLSDLEKRGLLEFKSKLTCMFVIDEETGGNGSLALALDRTLKERYDSILVLECTGNQLHPANRGAVFIRCAGRMRPHRRLPPLSLRAGQPTARPNEEPPAKQSPAADHTATASSHTTLLAVTAQERLPSIAEGYAFAILELLDEGDSIRQESDHPLFPQRPVQTCTGILGPFGVHPSAICEEVAFEVSGLEVDRETFQEWIDRGVLRYVARHGDKTQVLDPSTGRRKVERHYDISWAGDGRPAVRVHGAGGHMGSLPQNDAAIAKWANIVRELVEQRRATGAAFQIGFPGFDARSELVFEGAQGFLPTHSMEEVKTRSRSAFLRGLERYLAGEGLSQDCVACVVTFDKLHNESYACDADSDTVRMALRTAEEVGLLGRGEPLRGWEVSCDARLFAGEYPGMPVITFGAGGLEHAHSDREQVSLSDLFEAVRFTVLFVLKETGTIP